MMAAALWLVLLSAWTAGAEFRLASYYADHMVLQKEPRQAVIWGYGDSGASIMVTASMGPKSVKKVTEIQEGSKVWRVVLSPMAQGGPYTIHVQHYYKEEVSNVTLKDVYFGDVWLCSGQSNMEMTVSQIYNATQELAEASLYPLVRVFAPSLVQSEIELQDFADIILQWSVPTAENLGHGDFSYFSAVCWLFGRYLFETLKYPIGLVDSSWGGTPIEAWSSKKALNKCGISEDEQRTSSSHHDGGPKALSVTWNAMIHPLLNMTIKGVIWYQGEENTVMNTDLYNCTFPALIEDWREAFHEGSDGQTDEDFPFGFVQLCTYRRVEINDHFPRIRWHQTADYGYVPNKRMPNTFMAVSMDLGDDYSPYGSAHPRDKQTVAHRLHLAALAVAYDKKSIVFQGPYPQKVHVNIALAVINISYQEEVVIRHMDSKTFEVCCFHQLECHWSPVSIVSSLFHVVVLQNLVCPKAVGGLRYAWSEWPCDYKRCPIYNLQALPAPPFIAFPHDNPGWIVS